MTPCNAGRHDLDVVGLMPASPSRRGAGTCRECHRQRCREAARRYRKRMSWLREDSFNLDTGELVIDDVAIDAVVNGDNVTWNRGIRLTRDEAEIAVARMIRRGYRDSQIATYLGAPQEDVRRITKMLQKRQHRAGVPGPGPGTWREHTRMGA